VGNRPAALGEDARLRELIATANADDVAAAFSFAVINGNLEGVRIALDAGADPNARLAVHAHATALHQAAGADDVAMIELLMSRGARLDARDTLWDATPLEWAVHENRPRARAVLERAGD
jgi:ankyrin repeat protein